MAWVGYDDEGRNAVLARERWSGGQDAARNQRLASGGVTVELPPWQWGLWFLFFFVLPGAVSFSFIMYDDEDE